MSEHAKPLIRQWLITYSIRKWRHFATIFLLIGFRLFRARSCRQIHIVQRLTIHTHIRMNGFCFAQMPARLHFNQMQRQFIGGITSSDST